MSNCVELIRAYANKSILRDRLADLRKRIEIAPPRPTETSLEVRHKRLLTSRDIDEIAVDYQAGASAEAIAGRYGISKTRVLDLLRERQVPLRRQGLTSQQVCEAADCYTAGRSLAWIADRFGVSPMTVSKALKAQGIQLRPRPGRG